LAIRAILRDEGLRNEIILPLNAQI